MIKELKIRRMKDTDVEQIMFIQHSTNLSFWTSKDYLNEISDRNSIALIAEVDNQCIAFVVSRVFSTLPINESDEKDNGPVEAEILNFGVSVKLQRRGIGESLIRSLIEKLKHRAVSKVFLEVRSSNTKALRLYQKLGFTEMTVRKNYYSAPVEDAIVKQLDL